MEPEENGYRTEEQLDYVTAGAKGLVRTPLRAKKGRNVSQLWYARQGIITPEMEFVAIRENQNLEMTKTYLQDAEREARLKGSHLGRTYLKRSPLSLFAKRLPKVVRLFLATSTTLKLSR